jgi:hypothetical protein
MATNVAMETLTPATSTVVSGRRLGIARGESPKSLNPALRINRNRTAEMTERTMTLGFPNQRERIQPTKPAITADVASPAITASPSGVPA